MPSKAELKSLGERKGWTAREVSMREIRQQMSAEEVLWHEAFNKENFDRAFTLAENRRLNQERMPVWNVKRMWAGHATKEEGEKSRNAGDQFAIRHPQFERTIENAMLMVEYMKSQDLDATKVQSYETAFRELTAEGKLTLVEAESADDFLRKHPELHERRTPPIIVARTAKAEATQEYFAQAASARATGNVVNVVDYGPQAHGVPPEPDKYSFKQKVRSMSASEIAQRCQDDPAFHKALDKLK
jgi:hypothetical protein